MANDDALVIRQATSQDAVGLLALLKQLKTESTTFEDTSDHQIGVTTQAQQIEAIGSSLQQLLLVALIDDHPVGLATVLPTNEQQIGEIGVAVLKKYWQQGIGRELMLSGLDWAALQSQFAIITLTVQTVNQRAVKLYTDIGFETVRELQVTNSKGQRVAAIEMQLAVK
ncbi:GNAT family N-acetyltransferase [Secundilactobacillus folii]|nr:GNAT family N-acetyltransferase [Secundilactobacillus folii]